jgi:undecaprenyl pyrophosphate phosphatase UppP
MDSIMSGRFDDWVLLVAAIIVAMVIFASLEKIAKSLLIPLAIVAIVLIVAKVAFGLTPNYLWHESIHVLRRFGSRFL